MSSRYLNLTVVAASGDLNGIEQIDDVMQLFEPSRSVVLVCNSSNWLLASLTKLTAAYRVSSLEHLGSASGEIAVLDPLRADAAAKGIEQLLHLVSSDPGYFVRLMEEACTEGEVLDALRAKPDLPEPQYNPDNDWGFEEPLTAIGFLKGHLEVLKIARDSGRYAIHARS